MGVMRHQPQGLAQIAHTPITSGLRAVSLPGSPELFSGSMPNKILGIQGSSIEQGVNSAGKAWNLASTGIEYPGVPFKAGSFSLVIVGSKLGCTGVVSFGGIAGGNGWRAGSSPYNAETFRLTFGGVADYDLSTTFWDNTGKVNIAVLTFNSVTRIARLFKDGILVATRAVGVMRVPVKPMTMGASFNGTAYSDYDANASPHVSLVSLWDKQLTDAEAISLSVNPWQIFKTTEKNWRMFSTSQVIGGYTLPANAGIFSNFYSETGVKKSSKVVATSSPYTLIGTNTKVLNNRRIYAQEYVSSFTSGSTGLLSARKLSASVNVPFILTGISTGLLNNKRLLSQISSPYSIVNNSARLLFGRRIYAQTSNPVSISNVSVNLLSNRRISAQVNTQMQVSSEQTRLLNNKRVYAQNGILNSVASVTGLFNNRRVHAQSNASSISGISTSLKASRKIPVTVGIIPVNTYDAYLKLINEESGTVSGPFYVSSGVYSITNNSTGLRVDRKLASGNNGYILTPVNSRLIAARKMFSDVSIVNLADFNTRLLTGRKLKSDTQEYSLIGLNVVTKYFRRMITAADNYILNGSESKIKIYLRLNAAASRIYDAYGEISALVNRNLKISRGSLGYAGAMASLVYSKVGTSKFKKLFKNMFRRV